MSVTETGDRAFLSIGEVLDLLKDEFPDVTISKIRFLESQGLLDPERTPSGYRKFYSHDVERLKSILRMQRDEYLPLKVIKERLLHQDEGVEDGLSPDGEASKEDDAQPLDVGVVELAVAGRRPLGIDEALALEEADLRDRDVGEVVLQKAEHLSDGQVGAVRGGGRHGLPARKSSLNVPIWSSSPSLSRADSTRSRFR